MKFMTTSMPGPTPLPPEHSVALLQAAKGWISAKLADGTIDCVYSFFGGGGIAIGNADTLEELNADLYRYPLYPFFVWEVKPLLDTTHTIDQATELYKKMSSM